MRHRVWMVGFVLLAAVGLTACGGGGGQPGGGGAPAGGAPAGQVSVSEKEWAIEIPQQIASGSVTFNVKNDGAVEHNFVIQEANVRLDGIQPGQAKTLTVTLKPGTYTVVCDIPGHAEAGMKVTVTAK